MSGDLAIIIIGLSGASSAFLFVLSMLPVKSALSRKLNKLEERRTRAIKHKLESPLENVLTETQRGRIESALQQAGWYRNTPSQLLLRVIGGLAAGFAVVVAFAYFFQPPLLSAVIFAAATMVVGGYAPFWQLNAAIYNRKNEINRHLPDFLDLVATTVRAGLSLNASLAQAVEAMPNALGEEIKAALSEIRLGRSRADALTAMANRVMQEDLTTAVTAIVQAERLGANVTTVLAEAADDARHQRLMRAEESAAKLPIKLVFPMALCLIPAMYIIIFTPMVANLVQK